MAEGQKKILVYAQEAGGGNIAAIVAQALLSSGRYKLDIIAHLQGANPFKERGIPYRLLEDFGFSLPLEEQDAVGLLKELQANYLFGAFGNIKLDKSNGSIFKAAKRLNIKSISMLDCWKGWDRFHNGRQRFAYAPDILIVIDEHSKKKMIDEGFPEQRILIGGHPALDEIREFFVGGKANDRRTAPRQKYGIRQDEYLVVFASQMINHMSGRDDRRESYYSIDTQKGKVIDRLLSALQKTPMISGKSFVLMLRLHSKEDLPDSILSNYSRVRLITDKNIPRLNLYEIADCVIGYDTMMLAEAANAGCLVVSVQFPEIEYIPEKNLVELAGRAIYTAHNEIEFSEIFKNNLAYEGQPSAPLSDKISTERQKKNSYLEILFNEFPAL
jgi:hypothetical protein